MYESYFSLEKNPFAMTPDPAFLFQTPNHREALAGLVYSVLEKKGFVVLTGDAGTGKTTLLSRMLRTIPSEKVAFSLVLNPTLGVRQFLESALLDFGIEDVPESKVHRLLRLQRFVMTAHDSGRTCVLVVDEAHKLSPEVLEEIRLLTNFENAEHKLLQIVLAGQSELRDTLNSDNLRQLKQRISVRCELKPLSAVEVFEYIRFRWMKAGGGQQPPFDEEAIRVIVNVSRGIPRVINSVCDSALVLIFGAGDPVVTGAHARQVAGDLDLSELPPSKVLNQSHATDVARLNLPKPTSILGLALAQHGCHEPEAHPASTKKKLVIRLRKG